MSLREEQCNKVCRILDDVLANRPTERDSLILAVRKAFAEPKRGKWLDADICGELPVIVCDQCNTFYPLSFGEFHNFCPNCGAKMEVTT